MTFKTFAQGTADLFRVCVALLQVLSIPFAGLITERKVAASVMKFSDASHNSG